MRFRKGKRNKGRAAEGAGRSGARGWLARLGVMGFMFFLLKGLLWLAVPAVLLNAQCDRAA